MTVAVLLILASYLTMAGEPVDSLYHIYMNAPGSNKIEAANQFFNQLHQRQLIESPIQFAAKDTPDLIDTRVHHWVAGYKFDLEEFDEAMIHFLKKEKLLSATPELLTADEEKKVLIFRRENCIFALNFNPQGSFQDYGFAAPEGEYEMAFSSDDPRFGGFGRLEGPQRHVSVAERCPNGNQAYDHTLYLYLPCRCAIVLKKIV